MEFIIGYCAGCMMAFALAWLIFGEAKHEKTQAEKDQAECNKRLDRIELE